MKFATPAQKECYDKVAGWMAELFDDIPWESLGEPSGNGTPNSTSGPGFGLFMGSAWVEVRILPWDDESIVSVRSTVVTGADVTPELQAFLLQANADLQFGSFAVNRQGDIIFRHAIVGMTCDPEELETSVTAVLETADDYDDRIVETWGGDRALDRKI
ncbi:MAG: YbjN domain-containing protein [Cyanobacteria bacterium P01_D01_bin.123]